MTGTSLNYSLSNHCQFELNCQINDTFHSTVPGIRPYLQLSPRPLLLRIASPTVSHPLASITNVSDRLRQVTSMSLDYINAYVHLPQISTTTPYIRRRCHNHTHVVPYFARLSQIESVLLTIVITPTIFVYVRCVSSNLNWLPSNFSSSNQSTNNVEYCNRLDKCKFRKQLRLR